ncbi:MAG: hypothetical protein GY719_32020 [bacterium]|nr:hypothetical protein [bacterium]
MIEFVTLLLGLVTGSHPVELATVGPVAQIELRLDGRTVEVRRREPWHFECDFGRAIRPHELVAVARDAQGREVGRARRWVNLQKQAVADAAMVLSGGEQGRPEAVGLVWESLGQRRPQSIDLELDGKPLTIVDPAHVPLPAYDPGEVHYLSATLRFRDETVSLLETTFGGGRGSEMQSELTAVAVTLDKGTRARRPEDLAGWFLVDGEPVPVHGVEDGTADLVVVRDPGVEPVLADLFRKIERGQIGAVRGRAAYGSLGHKTSMRVMSSAGAPLLPTEVTSEMFVRSERFDAEQAGLLWLAEQRRPQSFSLMFPNAVALAGMQAHASTRRRAVVLLLGDSPADPGAYPASAARDYLRLLQVPFFVWALTPGERPEWPEARDLDLTQPRPGHRRLKEAVKELRRELEAQRVVWLEGRFLPQDVELAPEAVGIHLAGAP